MTAPRIVLNHAAVSSLLKSPKVAAKVREVAEGIAAAVDAQGLTVDSPGSDQGTAVVGHVDVTTTDRARASVTIRHPAGIALEAKHGVLSKAASATGNQINRRRR